MVRPARTPLIVVSGPPGSGKTTLAHALACAIACPAISRDEIKDRLVEADGEYKSSREDLLSRRTYEVFLGEIRQNLNAGLTVVAEAAFQDHLWRSGLEPLLDLADIRIIHCAVDPALAHHRIVLRLAE